MLFALEEIISDMNAPLLGSTVVASVASVIVERAILGNEPLFHVPRYQLIHPAELGAYAALGIAGGGVSLLFCKVLLGLRRRFLALPAHTRAWQPAVGGLVVGGLLLFTPAVMGVGYEYVDQALNGSLLLPAMLTFCALKSSRRPCRTRRATPEASSRRRSTSAPCSGIDWRRGERVRALPDCDAGCCMPSWAWARCSRESSARR